ncbi:MAG: PEP-CTERM sorting domain-containing protein, partial [Terriglobales bacterium]
NNPNFDSEAKSPGGTDLAGGIGELTFTLSGDPTFTQVVIHLRYDTPNSTNCSLFISNIARPGGPSPANRDECGTTEIPEPGSLALLGTGLFSAVGVLRRKLLKK